MRKMKEMRKWAPEHEFLKIHMTFAPGQMIGLAEPHFKHKSMGLASFGGKIAALKPGSNFCLG